MMIKNVAAVAEARKTVIEADDGRRSHDHEAAEGAAAVVQGVAEVIVIAGVAEMSAKGAMTVVVMKVAAAAGLQGEAVMPRENAVARAAAEADRERVVRRQRRPSRHLHRQLWTSGQLKRLTRQWKLPDREGRNGVMMSPSLQADS